MKFLKLSQLSKLLMATLVLLGLLYSGCKKDKTDPTPVAEDGIYIKGAGTAFDGFNTKALLKKTKNEVLQTERASLREIYIAVKAGSDGFNIVSVSGTTQTVYGPGADFAKVEGANLDVEEPKDGLWKGTLTVSNNKFTVPEDGLYHVIMDTELNKVAIARVKWGIIGGASPGGWSTNTPMTAVFNLSKMDFVVENVLMLKNDWKFRYSDGWKIILDKDLDLGGGQKGVKVNSNLGGSITALETGGGNIANTVYAIYKFTLTWDSNTGFSATQTKTGDGPPIAEYPETLHMIGEAVGGWDWAANGTPLIPVHSHPELFWKIVYLQGGKDFKFAPRKEWVGDFGKDNNPPVNGVSKKGSNNLTAPAASGYYMVVVDLKNETIEVADPSVHLIGDAVGSWDAGQAAQKFTVGADELTISRTLTPDKDIRMHVKASTLACDWWQAEFIVLNNKIEFRGKDGDQGRAKSKAAGITDISLNFKTGVGSIQ
ncbi:MAG: SusF/SusE family outer membrane protein [Saprospiraceae bacterium]|jgi:hypothetical protein|nr:SusF/SusE family outer membrane protein [Saprospiraceae bacterium]